jgi:hypothetical protein
MFVSTKDDAWAVLKREPVRYTGNEGASRETTFRSSAIVMCRASRAFDLGLPHIPPDRLLEDIVARATELAAKKRKKKPAAELGELRALVQEACVRQPWDFEQMPSGPVIAALRKVDTALALDLLPRLPLDEDSTAITELVRAEGWDRCGGVVRELLGRASNLRVPAACMLVRQLCGLDPRVVDQCVEELVPTLERKRPFDREQAVSPTTVAVYELLASLSTNHAVQALPLLAATPIQQGANEAVVAVVRAVTWERAESSVRASMLNHASRMPALCSLIGALAPLGPVVAHACATTLREVLCGPHLHSVTSDTRHWPEVQTVLQALRGVDRASTLLLLEGQALTRATVGLTTELVRDWTWAAVRSTVCTMIARPESELPAIGQLLNGAAAGVRVDDCAEALEHLCVIKTATSTTPASQWVSLLTSLIDAGGRTAANTILASYGADHFEELLGELSRCRAWSRMAPVLGATPALRNRIRIAIEAIERTVAGLRAIVNPGASVMASARFPADATVQRFLRSAQMQMSLTVGGGIANARAFAAQHGGLHLERHYAMEIEVHGRGRVR